MRNDGKRIKEDGGSVVHLISAMTNLLFYQIDAELLFA